MTYIIGLISAFAYGFFGRRLSKVPVRYEQLEDRKDFSKSPHFKGWHD